MLFDKDSVVNISPEIAEMMLNFTVSRSMLGDKTAKNILECFYLDEGILKNNTLEDKGIVTCTT